MCKTGLAEVALQSDYDGVLMSFLAAYVAGSFRFLREKLQKPDPGQPETALFQPLPGQDGLAPGRNYVIKEELKQAPACPYKFDVTPQGEWINVKMHD